MRKLLLFAILFSSFVACKKEEDDAPEAPSVSFTATSGYTITLPKVITFTAASNSADQVNWDFGDGSTGQGFTVQHSFTAYGNYKVKATAVKGSATASATRDVPVTFFKRVDIKGIRVLQIPPYKAGGQDWDAGDYPDLTYSITFPGDTVYNSLSVLNNTSEGYFSIAPPRSTYIFTEDVKIQLFDKDSGNVPDKETIGFLKFRFCDYLPSTVVYPDSIDISSNAIRMIVKFDYVY